MQRLLQGRWCAQPRLIRCDLQRQENKPEGAAARCLDCKHADTCPYSAKRGYLDHVARGYTGWPISVCLVDDEGVRCTEGSRRKCQPRYSLDRYCLRIPCQSQPWKM